MALAQGRSVGGGARVVERVAESGGRTAGDGAQVTSRR